MKNICIASDHAGYDLKLFIKTHLTSIGYNVIDFGASSSESIDYPDVAHPFAENINSGKHSIGIIICGSGNGVNMVVNKYENIRSALCWTEEIAILAKQHNNANVIALPARFINNDKATSIVDAFLKTQFEGGRHLNRINKIPKK